jgi:hypothetical protein
MLARKRLVVPPFVYVCVVFWEREKGVRRLKGCGEEKRLRKREKDVGRRKGCEKEKRMWEGEKSGKEQRVWEGEMDVGRLRYCKFRVETENMSPRVKEGDLITKLKCLFGVSAKNFQRNWHPVLRLHVLRRRLGTYIMRNKGLLQSREANNRQAQLNNILFPCQVLANGRIMAPIVLDPGRKVASPNYTEAYSNLG